MKRTEVLGLALSQHVSIKSIILVELSLRLTCYLAVDQREIGKEMNEISCEIRFVASTKTAL